MRGSVSTGPLRSSLKRSRSGDLVDPPQRRHLPLNVSLAAANASVKKLGHQPAFLGVLAPHDATSLISEMDATDLAVMYKTGCINLRRWIELLARTRLTEAYLVYFITPENWCLFMATIEGAPDPNTPHDEPNVRRLVLHGSQMYLLAPDHKPTAVPRAVQRSAKAALYAENRWLS